MPQTHFIYSEDFRTNGMDVYRQRLMELVNKKRVVANLNSLNPLSHTQSPLDFNEIHYLIKNNPTKTDSKLSVETLINQNTNDLTPTKVFEIVIDNSQKEDIQTFNRSFEEELHRSYIPCFYLGTKRLFKYSNKFLIQDGKEEIELNFQSIKNLSALTFEEFIHSITNTSLPKTTFNNKEVIKFLLRSHSIQDEIQLTLLTKLMLDLPNIQTLTAWREYLNEHKSFNLLPKTFLEALIKAGTNINPIFFTYYDFIKTYFDHHKRAI